jgi:hypothetical protein
MSKPQRSLRLEKRSARSLQVLSGAPGEIFFDNDNGTLRVYTDTAGDSIILANRQWVVNNTFSGDFNDLTNRPTALSAFTNDAGYITQSTLGDLSPTSLGFAAGTAINEFSTDGTLSDNSNQAVPTEAAVKTYVDTAISGLTPAALEDLTDVNFTGSPQTNEVLIWNGTEWANSPVQVNLSSYYTSAETDSAISTAISNFQTTIVDAAPAALDTLNELAAALGDDSNFASTVTTALSGKEPTITAGTTGQYWRGDKSWQTLNATAVGLGNVTNESKATMFTSPTFTGTVTLQQSTEILNTKTSATGTVDHDFSTGAVFYHSNISSDFTANFTNVPTTDNRTISVVLILSQGLTAYLPTAVQIDGAAQTINWLSNAAPTGTASQLDFISFTFIRVGAAWSVVGSISTYGAVA